MKDMAKAIDDCEEYREKRVTPYPSRMQIFRRHFVSIGFKRDLSWVLYLGCLIYGAFIN